MTQSFNLMFSLGGGSESPLGQRFAKKVGVI